ncbi:hypothetical protein [Candidatus Palauibacter sp.]|uniref:hypothetical protein n=1 Tax=Candidatus Palauibacter sp. TaxID=3101350 RepID=UPI003AF212FD
MGGQPLQPGQVEHERGMAVDARSRRSAASRRFAREGRLSITMDRRRLLVGGVGPA